MTLISLVVSCVYSGILEGGPHGASVGKMALRIREGAIADSGRSPKLSEFDVFASGRPEIGQNSPTAKLYARSDNILYTNSISGSVVLVNALATELALANKSKALQAVRAAKKTLRDEYV